MTQTSQPCKNKVMPSVFLHCALICFCICDRVIIFQIGIKVFCRYLFTTTSTPSTTPSGSSTTTTRPSYGTTPSLATISLWKIQHNSVIWKQIENCNGRIHITISNVQWKAKKLVYILRQCNGPASVTPTNNLEYFKAPYNGPATVTPFANNSDYTSYSAHMCLKLTYLTWGHGGTSHEWWTQNFQSSKRKEPNNFFIITRIPMLFHKICTSWCIKEHYIFQNL